MGRQFLAQFVHELKGCRERKWNYERPAVFVLCMLQTTGLVTKRMNIVACLQDRLEFWSFGGLGIAELVDNTELEMRSRRGGGARSADLEREAKAFDSRVKNGKIRSAVRIATDRGGGGVLMPDGVCTKTGKPVMEVLQEKHPPLVDPAPPLTGGAPSSHTPGPPHPSPYAAALTPLNRLQTGWEDLQALMG